ncbi:MAG TPA: hypothetical protein VNT77_02030 [Allosphingosinicella sp.]|nr:hypothetical protein [Allosphingosinicella sp.]
MTYPFRHPKWMFLFFVALLSLAATASQAAVRISFYSKELGASFPHAFIELEGTDDRTGAAVRDNYGFTAKTISPAILMGSVTGEVMAVDQAYVRNSDLHFSFVLTDAEYDRVKATIEKWRMLKQPSYNLNRQNCVYFVADVAASLGMRAETPKALMKKPRSFTESLVEANQSWLAARGATLGKRYAEANK